MRAAREYCEAMLRGGGRRVLPQPQKFELAVAGLAMRLGRDFDLGLQKFAPDVARRAEIRALEERIRCLRGDLQGLRVGEKVFFLDAELEQIVGHEGAGKQTRWNQCPDAQAPLVGLKSEFHRVKFLVFASQHFLVSANNSVGQGKFLQSFDLRFKGLRHRIHLRDAIFT